MADEDFIEVNVAASVPFDTTTVLHNFSDCDLQFHSLLKNGGGIQATITPTSSAATLVMSSSGSVFGSNLTDYSATAMYIVPKIHTSNRMPQVSSTDVELILEHSSATGSRVFLCAIVSTDESVAPPESPNANGLENSGEKEPNLKGYDAGVAAFLHSLDFSSYDPAQFKSSNSKHLPFTATFTFPGITECLAYQDSAQPQNTVLLLPVPLIVDGPLLRSLNRMLVGGPVFSDFDLHPLKGGPITRKQFQPNVSLSSSPSSSPPVEGMTQRTTPTKSRVSQGEADATFALNVVSVLLVGVALAIPIWIFGPQTYLLSVEKMGGLDPAGINMGILATKIVFCLLYVVSFVLVGVGSAQRIWPMLILGTLLTVYSTVFLLSVMYDINTGGTVLEGLEGTTRERMNEVLHFNYQSN